jgi:cytochrome P450
MQRSESGVAPRESSNCRKHWSLTDPEIYASGAVCDLWREMRLNNPVSWHETESQEGFWSVTAYRPAYEVMHDWQRFTSTKGVLLRPNLSDPYPGAGRMLVLTDPPRHDVIHRAIRRLFTARATARLETRARVIARSLVRAAVAAGECDFVTQVAAQFPLRLLAELLGVPADELAAITAAVTSAAESAADMDGPENRQAHYELLMYYAELLEKRRVEPGDDLASALAQAQLDGAGITDEEAILTCDNVVVAADSTTRNTAASGLLALIEHPDQWRALRAGDLSYADAVEEIIRYEPPVTHILRTATRATTLHGAEIGADQAVVVWLPSINRDEAVFADADAFRIDRRPNRHLSFAGGVHFCLGAALARRGLRVLLEELDAASRDIVLAGRPRRLASHMLWGLAELPIRLLPA